MTLDKKDAEEFNDRISRDEVEKRVRRYKNRKTAAQTKSHMRCTRMDMRC